jgi:tetratricopeptide (TPR) repeat protein
MNGLSDTSQAAKRPASAFQKVSQRVVVLVAILIVAGPVGYSFGRREMARWYGAAGFECLLEGDLTGALTCIDKAIAYNPHDLNQIMRRANWKMRTGSVKTALPDCDLALELARAEVASGGEGSQSLLASALNQRAYAYALDGSNLEQALQNVEQALGIVGNDYNMQDTRGYLHLKLGNLDAAQYDLEQALKSAENSYKQDLAFLRTLSRESVDQRPIQAAQRTLREALAVLTHHRGELYEQLGREEDAIRDLRRAKRLGFDPRNGVW